MTHAELVYEHLKRLPESVAAEVLDFVQLLEQKQAGTRQPRRPGSARGQVWIVPTISTLHWKISRAINEPTAQHAGDLAYHPSKNHRLRRKHCRPWLPALLQLSISGEFCHDTVH
jgi:hypothetical protein